MLEPDRLLGVFQKRMIYWDDLKDLQTNFCSLKIENSLKKRQYPVNRSFVGKNVLIAYVRGQRRMVRQVELIEKVAKITNFN